jgi:ribosomal protein L40E
MPLPDHEPTEPAGPAAAASPAGNTSTPPAGPGVLTALVCERCGNVNLIRVKGCWYCEKCHYKFDCYGF